jgi:uncharacterized protein DUF6941
MGNFPTIESCLICEGVRNETGNKLTVLGLFGLAPIEIFVGDFSKPAVLCLLFLCKTGSGNLGSYHVSLRIYNPDGTLLAEPTVPMTVNFNFDRPKKFMFAITTTLPIQQEGDYSVELIAEGQTQTKVVFSLRKGTPAQASAPRTWI